MEKLLTLYTYIDGVNDTPFPSVEDKIEVLDFTYNARRMGEAPNISATIKHGICLDNLWSDNVYAELNGERFFLKNTPTSQYDSSDSRYRHDVVLVSERINLENVYFFDVVSEETDADKPVSNSSNVVFSGNIRELAERLRLSLKFSGLDYTVVVDEAVENEDKLVSFSDQYISDVLQESYNIYGVPHYFVGREIHFGDGIDSIDKVFEYGVENALISITKSNANSKVVTRCTGDGSDSNIPYYYPNKSPYGEVNALYNGIAVNGLNVTNWELFSRCGVDSTLTYEKSTSSGTPVKVASLEDFKSERVEQATVLLDQRLYRWACSYKVLLGANQKIHLSYGFNSASGYNIGYDILDSNGVNVYKTITMPINGIELWAGSFTVVIYIGVGRINTLKEAEAYARANAFVNLSVSSAQTTSGWRLNDDRLVSLSSVGITYNGTPAVGDKITFEVISQRVPVCSRLMPSIYRETNGKERFYNAISLKYDKPENRAEKYIFSNEFVASKPKEHIVHFEDIKPTIQGVTNAAAQRIDKFLDIAYDLNDSDERVVNDGSEEYLHKYFFVKLRKFDGINKFNLFAHAIEGRSMTVSMTSGHCSACEWPIQVSDDTMQNRVQVYERDTIDANGVQHYAGELKRNDEGDVIFGAPQDCQNDTINNEVWIALLKDDSTFGTLMPSSVHKPTTNDTFVLLNISLPEAYILAAEKRLEDEIIKYMSENNDEKFNFSIKFSRIYLAEHPEILTRINENAIIRVSYNNIVHKLHVSSFSYKTAGAPIPEVTVELSDTIAVNGTPVQTVLSAITKAPTHSTIVSEVRGNANAAGNILAGVGATGIKGSMTLGGTPSLGGNAAAVVDIEKEGKEFFVSKKGNESITGEKTFHNNVIFGDKATSEDFVQDPLFGKGWGVYRDANNLTVGEFDKIIARRTLDISELKINQTTYQRGRLVISNASCKITEVEEFENFYRCYFDNKSGSDFSGFVVNDQAICQRYDETFSDVTKYYWRLVVGVSASYVDLSKDDATGFGIPAIDDEVIQLGHRSDITRQNAIVIASTPAPTIIQYNGIRSFVLPEPSTVISPDNNVFSGVMRIMPGSTGLSDMEEFKDLRSEVSSVTIDLEHTNEEVDRYGTLVDEIKEQADKEYIIWFFDHIPTLTNEPARDWTTEELIELHDQDLFYSKPLGRAWRFVDGQWEEITDADTIAALRESNNATQRVDELEGVINNYGVDLEIVKNQLDKEFTIWFAEEDAPESYVPTNNNYPAVDWNTESLQVLHDQDLFYNRKSGKAWRYEDRAWVEITDADTIAALNKAGEAYNNAERVDHRVDDLEAIVTENKTFVDEVVAPALDSLQRQIDGAIESFFYEVEPTLDNIPAKDWTTEEQKKAHLNDTYTNLTDGRSWRWTVSGTTYGWTEITDTATAKALQEAGLAKDTADNKRRVFVAQPTNAQAYDEGDLWVNATYGTTYTNDLLRCKTAKPEGAAFSISHWELATKYTDDTKANNALAIANESKNYIDKVLPGILEELQNQLDGKVENFFYDYDPTTSNIPASEWTTNELKEAHLNDTFTNTTSGQSWRWLFKDGTYKWVEIADTQSAEALRVAMEAKAAADGKITTYYGTTVTPPYAEGDLWVQGVNGDIFICISGRDTGSYTASDWAKASKYTDDSALTNFINGAFANTIAEVKGQIDGKAETWYQASDPSSAWNTTELKAAHVGDLWYNTSNNTTSRWSGSKWEAQSVPSEVFDKIDGKADIFVSESRPTPPYNVNDLWSRGDKGQLMICVRKRSAGESTSDSDWTIADDSHKYADDLKDEIEQNFKDDYEYLTKALPADSNLATTVANAMVLSSLLGVWDNNKNVVSFLNGSDLGKDSTHGKLMFAAGVPTSGANLASRAANAKFRVYEDGTIIAEQGLFKGQVILGDGKITLNQDGSGSLADGSLTWDKYGIMTSVFPIMEKWQDIFTLTTTGSTYTRVDLSQVGYLDNVCQATGVEDTRSIFYLDTANTTMRDGFTLKMRGAIVYNSALYPAAIRSWNGEKFYAAGRDDGDISFYPETYLVSDTFFMPLGGPPITLTYKQAGGLSANNPYWIVDFPAAYKKVYVNQTDGAIYAQTYLDNMDNPSPLSE